MPTNKQRRETARRQLERQLERRQERESRRRRTNMILSAGGAVVLVVVIVVVLLLTVGGSGKSSTASSASPTPTDSATTSAAPTSSAAPAPAATGAAVSFDGVTVGGAADLKGKPEVTTKGTTDPAKLAYKDLVVGKGAAAKSTDTVTIQYDGVLYKGGTEFDASWNTGQAATFPLNQVVPGFAQAIGGTTGIPPMKVGGRRVVIIPSKLGYGATGSAPKIPANAPLVFVIDLTAISTGSASTPAG